MRNPKKRRGISVGTVLMVICTLAVCLVSTVLLEKISGGETVAIHVRKAADLLSLQQLMPELELANIPITKGETGEAMPQATIVAPEMPAWKSESQQNDMVSITMPPLPAVTTPPKGGTFSLTVGGSVCVETGVRRSGYYSDVKTYDFSEIFSLLGREFDSDINMVSLENLIVPSAKVTDTIAPAEIGGMLSLQGVDTVNLGFANAYAQKLAGLQSTVEALTNNQLRVVGAYAHQADAELSNQIVTVGGVRVALLHYTDTLTAKTAKSLAAEGAWALPSSEQAAGDIARVKDAGAQVVIVSINWGTAGKTAPSKAQIELAEMLANSGVDVLLGTGSRVVQPVAWVNGTLLDGSTHEMLCFYSLGTLISDNRKDAQVAGMLAKLTIHVDETGKVSFLRSDYLPTYVWRFKQEGQYSYRVVLADRPAPDGMESSQQKSMANAYTNIVKVLGDDVVSLREQP